LRRYGSKEWAIIPILHPNNGTGARHTVEKIVILVVEDEAIIRMGAVAMLEEAGFSVLQAWNADIAVNILESRKDIRAVFTDANMPGALCGLKLAKAIRDRWPATHIIVTSGRDASNELDFPELARFIGKPYAPIQVLRALGELLDTETFPSVTSPTEHRT
jgi:CheY-like chemotaxis protein